MIEWMYSYPYTPWFFAVALVCLLGYFGIVFWLMWAGRKDKR